MDQAWGKERERNETQKPGQILFFAKCTGKYWDMEGGFSVKKYI